MHQLNRLHDTIPCPPAWTLSYAVVCLLGTYTYNPRGSQLLHAVRVFCFFLRCQVGEVVTTIPSESNCRAAAAAPFLLCILVWLVYNSMISAEVAAIV